MVAWKMYDIIYCSVSKRGRLFAYCGEAQSPTVFSAK